MSRKVFIILLFSAAIVLEGSCTRKMVPRLMQGREYNVAGYNNLYVEAVKQKLLGNIGNALECFEKCIDINPMSDASYYQMAQIMISRGDLNNGKKFLRKACEISPGNLWYNMLLAGIYHQENNLDSTIVCYERAVKGNPGKDELLISLAGLYTEKKEFGKARGILNDFDEKFGVNEKTSVTLVETLLAEGKKKEALQKVQQLLEGNPDDIILNGYLAEIYGSEGNNEKAREVYSNLVKRNPNNPGIQLSLVRFLIKDKSFGELFDLLNIVVLNDKIAREEKVSLFSELIEIPEVIQSYGQSMELALMLLEAQYKDDGIIVLLRPEFLQSQKKSREAAARLEEIIRSYPENYFAWERLLFMYLELRDFKNLEQRGRECATKFNRSVTAKMLYANAALENGNYNVALDELRKADILAGDNKEIRLQIILLRADLYYRMKSYDEAFKAYDEALKINNNDLTVMNNYAYYLAEQGINLKDAEKMAKIVIEKDKNNNTFLDTYAWVLFKRGKAREAARIMERILASDENNDAEYYEHYGFILKKIGRCGDAVKSWEKAVLLDSAKSELKNEILKCGK
ncbi:MAG TPA: tetratricopeptide repeat protein [Bacteroidales bacterium]|nr:tetratricopeptide repeat protein [Bacteroidales bacterium]